MERVKALVFDVFGTVVDWREGIARDAAPFLARHGRGDIDPRAFADAWRRRYQPAMEECRAGRRPFTRLAPARIGEAELDELNRAWHRLDPWPEAVAGLTRLRRKYILAPLSNGNVALLLNMAKRAAIPWDAILGAEVAGAYKPRPEAYLRTADVLGIRAEELCLVAAHNGDLKAARACGLATAFVTRPTEHGPGQSTDLEPSEPWDVVARDFQDLAAKLGC